MIELKNGNLVSRGSWRRMNSCEFESPKQPHPVFSLNFHRYSTLISDIFGNQSEKSSQITAIIKANVVRTATVWLPGILCSCQGNK